MAIPELVGEHPGGVICQEASNAIAIPGTVATAAGHASLQEAVTVSMQGLRFHPGVLTVAPGTTVIGSHDEDDTEIDHNVLTLDGPLASPYVRPGANWSFTLTVPGRYACFCELHECMVGRMIVQQRGRTARLSRARAVLVPTTGGFGADEMRRVAAWILRVLDHPDDEAEHARVGAEVSELAATFPVPGVD
jgi:plastocyanin